MLLIIGGERKQHPEGITVRELLAAEQVENPDYVSVAVNDEFVRTGEFDTVVLREQDVVEFLYYMGGGR